MIIKGNNIILRPVEKKDFPILYKWINDPLIASLWYGRDKPRSQEWICKHFQKIIDKKDNSGCFIIEFKNNPVGFMYNTPTDHEGFTGEIELDIMIGETNLHSKGLGSEAMKTMINYCFKIQKAERVFLRPFLFNTNAINFYKKIGFKIEGILRHIERFEGKWQDGLMMSIIKEEWHYEN